MKKISSGLLRRISCLFRWVAGHRRIPGPGDAHNLSAVGYLRYAQAIREDGPRKNPDDLVQHFLSDDDKKRAKKADMTALRSIPFYHYLLARTKFYDKEFNEAIMSGIKQIVILGVGTDTRSFRFKHKLLEHSVRVIETDLEPSITARTAYAEQFGEVSNVRQCELDLEHVGFDDWITKASFDPGLKTFFLGEGVTPYVSLAAVENLLSFIKNFTPSGSRIAYDFKITGQDDDLGKKENGQPTFRLPNSKPQIERFHSRVGLVPDKIIFGQDLQNEFLDYEAPLFLEDGLVTATRS